jgi:hypothetical protein
VFDDDEQPDAADAATSARVSGARRFRAIIMRHLETGETGERARRARLERERWTTGPSEERRVLPRTRPSSER